MAVDRPSAADVARLAGSLGFPLSEGEADEFTALVDEALRSHDWLDGAEDGAPAAPAGRDRGYRPDDDENRLGGWYWKTEIHGPPGGPLTGRTVAVKDNIAVGGVPLMNGSAVLDGYVPEQDATVVARVLAAGATIAGKAVCEALCYSGSSHTSDTGPVLNPYDLRRSSGGSSSGCGALLADRQVDLAIGGDQGGSIRCPSSWSGVVGLKPTYGLVPYTGAFPLEMTLDHLGPMARTVADTALLLDVLAGPDGLDPRQAPPLDDQVSGGFADAIGRGVAGLRVGVLEEGFGHAVSEPDVDEVGAGRGLELRAARRPRRDGLRPLASRRGQRLPRDRGRGLGGAARPRRRARYQLARALHDEHAGSVRGREAVATGSPATDGQAAGDRRAVDARDLPRPLLREGPEPRARR